VSNNITLLVYISVTNIILQWDKIIIISLVFKRVKWSDARSG